MLKNLISFFVLCSMQQGHAYILKVINNTDVPYNRVTVVLLAEDFNEIYGRHDSRPIPAQNSITELINNMSLEIAMTSEKLSLIEEFGLSLSILVVADPTPDRSGKDRFLQVFRANEVLDEVQKGIIVKKIPVLGGILEALKPPDITVTIHGLKSIDLQVDFS